MVDTRIPADGDAHRNPSGTSQRPTLARQFAAVDPSRLFVVGGPTYAEMATRSGQLANELLNSGIRPGDRVAVQVAKSLDGVALYLACVRTGIVIVPINPAWSPTEVARIDADPALFVDDARLAELVSTSRGRGDHIAVEPAPDDLAVLMYTSGTTGAPKGAMLTQTNIASNVEALVDAWGIGGADVLLHALPVFHAHGLFVALGCVIRAGIPMCWLERFDPGEVIAALPRCTVMMGVPTFYTRLLSDPSFTHDVCAAVRLFVSGSAPLTPAVHEAFRQRTGHTILERYGMTETVMLASNPLHGERRPGSVGPPLPGVEIRLDGEESLTGREVVVRGPNVMAGYWRRPRVEEWIVDDDDTGGPWFRTGDLGHFDADGYLWLTGRAKDLIITGGLNVSPLEVEQVLDALPGVRESAVIGVPDADLGEAVVAVVTVVGAVSAEDVRAAARMRLAGYKSPKRVIVVDALPRNAMGKVEKAALRDRYGAGS